jgi:hypothetical protein
MRRGHTTGHKRERRMKARERVRLEGLGTDIARQLRAKSLADLLELLTHGAVRMERE